MFQRVAVPRELIFYHLTSPKLDLEEVEKGTLKAPLALQTHFLPFGRPKMRYGRDKKAIFQGVARRC
jgi:hypothetical protein